MHEKTHFCSPCSFHACQICWHLQSRTSSHQPDVLEVTAYTAPNPLNRSICIFCLGKSHLIRPTPSLIVCTSCLIRSTFRGYLHCPMLGQSGKRSRSKILASQLHTSLHPEFKISVQGTLPVPMCRCANKSCCNRKEQHYQML